MVIPVNFHIISALGLLEVIIFYEVTLWSRPSRFTVCLSVTHVSSIHTALREERARGTRGEVTRAVRERM